MKPAPCLFALALLSAAPAVAQTADRRMIQRLHEADADRNGVVLRTEWVAYRATQFARFDRNRDGVLSMTDVPRFVRAAPFGLSPKSMIAEFDRNGDAAVDRAEYLTGPTVAFDRLDADHDGAVSEAELRRAAP